MLQRAYDLSEGEVSVVGLTGIPQTDIGAIPVRLHANIPGAVSMRVGNTPEELALADWTAYSAESAWAVPTGEGHTVYIEFIDGTGQVTAVSVAAPHFDPDTPSDYVEFMPLTGAIPHNGLFGPRWNQDFSRGRDGWVSEASGEDGRDLFPASWSATGGLDDSAYAWTDASRWSVVQNGEAILLAARPGYANPFYDALNLDGVFAEFYLRGDGLDLGGATLRFYVDDASGRWAYDQPVEVAAGEWSAIGIPLTDVADWEPLSGQGGGIDFTSITGWGLSATGLDGETPLTGRLGIDGFRFIEPIAAAPTVHNLDQTLAVDEDGAPVDIVGLSIEDEGHSVEVKVRLSDPEAGALIGAGPGINGVYTLTGTAGEVNALLAGLAFQPTADWNGSVTLDLTVRQGRVDSPLASGVITVNVAATDDVVTVAGLGRTYGARPDAGAVWLDQLNLVDPDLDGSATVTLTLSDPAAGRLNLPQDSGGNYVAAGSVAEVNALISALTFFPAGTLAGEIGIAVHIETSQGQSLDGTLTVQPVTAAGLLGDIVVAGGTPLSALEGASSGEIIASLTLDGATDPTGGVFRLLDDAGGRVSLSSDGLLRVADGLALDYEGATAHQIRVRFTDASGAVVDQTLALNVEDVVGEVIQGDGRNNTLRGGTGADVFHFSAGADLLIGGLGDDTYYVDHPGDQVFESPGEGSDLIYANVSYRLQEGADVERLSASDHFGTAALDFYGNEISNTLYGNAGRNRLDGGAGADFLLGLGGDDLFVFSTSLTEGGNPDVMGDFSSGDRIALNQGIFAALEVGALQDGAFSLGSTATTADHRILYDQAGGVLLYDADGVGGAAAIEFARVEAGTGIQASDFVVEARAVTSDDLTANQVVVVGSIGPDGAGPSVMQVLANIPHALWMRLGSTAEEIARAEWVAYDPDSSLLLRTGSNQRTVYAEYVLEDGTIFRTSALAPPRQESATTGFPSDSDAYQVGSGTGLLWSQSFDENTERWGSYDYDSETLFVGHNTFFHTSFSASGGVGDSGYVWIDDSRWLIDTPEEPMSVLALLSYPAWYANGQSVAFDFAETSVEFYLRGDDLDLKGAEAYFWVVTDSGRWKAYDVQLNIGDGDWAFNSLTLSDLTAGAWQQSFAPQPGGLDFSRVFSWGIGLVGFDTAAEPSGVLALDEFKVLQSGTRLNVDGLDRTVTVSQHAEGVGLGAIVLSDPSAKTFVTVTLQLADAEAGALTGAGVPDQGRYTLSGPLDAVNRQLAEVRFIPGGGTLDSAVLVSVQSARDGADPVHGLLYIDVDAAPTGLDFGVVEVMEKSATGTIVTEFAGVDAEGGPFVFTLIDDAGGRFSLDADGVLRVADPAGIDFEAASSHEIVVRVTDDHGGSHTQSVTVQLLDYENEPVFGTASDEVLEGDGENNRIDGGGGSDVMIGHDGDDTYLVDDATDLIVEAPGEGMDVVMSRGSYWLAPAAHVEILSTDHHLGVAAIDLTGNELAQRVQGNEGINILSGGGGDDAVVGGGGDDRLYGDDGDDILDGEGGHDYLVGGAGFDRLYGGAGDDTYIVEDSADLVLEAAGEGVDHVLSRGDYALAAGAHVESLGTDYNLGVAAVNLTGNELAQRVQGNEGNNILSGGGGDDAVVGGGGDDRLYGDDGDDILNGGSGDDYLVGGAGFDRLYGAAGDDTYIVEDSADLVVEAAGEGVDYVLSRGDYALAAGAHVESLGTDYNLGVAAVNLTGNELAQRVQGNEGNNILSGGGGDDAVVGGGGDDRLYGDDGDDILNGGSGDDYLVGGAGFDRLYGAAGDDTYIIEDSADLVVEAANEGVDYVLSRGDYALAAGAHVESLSTDYNLGVAAVNLTGNELAQRVQGNEGNNILSGGGGDDAVVGGGGDDRLFGDDGDDILNGGSGDDYLIGGAGDDRFVGGEGTDTLIVSGLRADYLLTGADGVFTLHDMVAGRDGVDVLSGVEWIEFADGTRISPQDAQTAPASGRAQASITSLNEASPPAGPMYDPLPDDDYLVSDTYFASLTQDYASPSTLIADAYSFLPNWSEVSASNAPSGFYDNEQIQLFIVNDDY